MGINDAKKVDIVAVKGTEDGTPQWTCRR